MTAPGSGWLRYARASIVASIAVTVSVAGHVLGGGHAPHPLAIAILVGLATVPAYALGSRRLTRVGLIGLLATAQVVIHLVLSGATSSTAHHHDAVAGQTASITSSSPLLMVIGHAFATLAIGLILASSETLLWRLWAWLSSCWPRFPRLVSRTSHSTAPISIWFVRTRAPYWLGRQEPPRGPPRLLDLVAA